MSYTVATTEAAATAQPRKRRRVFRWVSLAIQALFIIWLIVGGAKHGGSIHASGGCRVPARGEGHGHDAGAVHQLAGRRGKRAPRSASCADVSLDVWNIG